MSGYLRSSILGHSLPPPPLRVSYPSSWHAPGLRQLNESQLLAVKRAFEHPLTLIQGPPGTGKTETAATLVYHYAQQGRGAVLVCAASNAAADHLAEKILLTKVSVVRLRSRSHPPPEGQSSSLSLSSHLEALSGDSSSPASEYQRLLRLRSELEELSPVDAQNLESVRRSSESEVLKRVEVVVCTCSTAAETRLVSRSFRY